MSQINKSGLKNPSREDLKVLLICVAIIVLFLISSGIVLFGGFLILVAALVSKKGRAFFNTLGTLKPRTWKEFFVVVLGAFALIIPANALIVYLVEGAGTNVMAEDAMLSEGAGFYLLLVSVLVAAVLEEIVFRGYLLTRLSKIFGTSNTAIALTVGVTSLFFGMAHYYQTGMQSALMIGFFSMVIGVIFIKTNFNLGYAIAIHVINNGLFMVVNHIWG